MKCLLVDDDAAIRQGLVHYLGQHGVAAEALPDGGSLRRELPQRLAEARVDVLVLDLMLPDDDGLALCQWAKQRWPALQVIMLTAQGDPTSRVLGLEMGADDYLGKPFEPRELLARMRATLRRGQAVAASAPVAEKRFAGWRFDRIARRLQAADSTLVALSAAEFRLLAAFVDHAGQLLTRERLLVLTRAPGVEVNDRSIDLAVSRLRQKLGDPQLIRTQRGEGYLFDVKLEG
jgi:two-component system OmpR family response regulator